MGWQGVINLADLDNVLTTDDTEAAFNHIVDGAAWHGTRPLTQHWCSVY